MSQNLYIDNISDRIEECINIFNNSNSITDRNTLMPTYQSYPLKANNWIKIKDVISVFVDIRGSTRLSASVHYSSTASIYEFFTGTAIRIFHEMGAEYIDVKGDGVFALFSNNKIHNSLASAITFKTFGSKTFLPMIKRKLGKNYKELDIGFHMGIDMKTVLVKQVGIKNDTDRGDIRKNEVWAGKPINMSAKLASLSEDGELYVSDRYYNALSNSDLIHKTCGCGESGEKTALWEKVELNNNSNFDFTTAYVLENHWCDNHGKQWCMDIINLDT